MDGADASRMARRREQIIAELKAARTLNRVRKNTFAKTAAACRFWSPAPFRVEARRRGFLCYRHERPVSRPKRGYAPANSVSWMPDGARPRNARDDARRTEVSIAHEVNQPLAPSSPTPSRLRWLRPELPTWTAACRSVDDYRRRHSGERSDPARPGAREEDQSEKMRSTSRRREETIRWCSVS